MEGVQLLRRCGLVGRQALGSEREAGRGIEGAWRHILRRQSQASCGARVLALEGGEEQAQPEGRRQRTPGLAGGVGLGNGGGNCPQSRKEGRAECGQPGKPRVRPVREERKPAVKGGVQALSERAVFTVSRTKCPPPALGRLILFGRPQGVLLKDVLGESLCR